MHWLSAIWQHCLRCQGALHPVPTTTVYNYLFIYLFIYYEFLLKAQEKKDGKQKHIGTTNEQDRATTVLESLG
jgi:hypothetical protein